MTLGQILLVLGIYLLAAARLTRVANADTIAEPVRLWIAHRAETASTIDSEAVAVGEHTRALVARKRAARWVSVYDFLICPWCVGFWIALGGAFCAVWIIKYGWQWDWWAILPVGLACSHLIGVFARFAND